MIMYIIKGYVFHYDEDGTMTPMKLSDILAQPFKVNTYEQAHACFEGVPYYMFLLSPIKEKEETE